MNLENLAKYIDHTNLRQTASENDIIKLCQEAKIYGFFSVCINPYYLKLAKKELYNSEVKVCTVIGFPLGMNSLETKIAETKFALENGADEFDLVINIANLKSHDEIKCLKEIHEIKKTIGSKILKIIVETSQLNEINKKFAAELILKSEADFIKTSTGFIGSGANLDDIKLWKKIIGNKKKIKASGGVSNHQEFIAFIKTGADRIGSSKGVLLLK